MMSLEAPQPAHMRKNKVTCQEKPSCFKTLHFLQKILNFVLLNVSFISIPLHFIKTC